MKGCASRLCKKQAHGFTLVEILVVLVISSVLIMGLHAILQQARLLWSSVEQTRPVFHEVRNLTHILRQELAGVYYPVMEDNDAAPPLVLTSHPQGEVELTFFTSSPSWRQGFHAA